MSQCPRPFSEDNGTARQCIESGHCGCDERDKIFAKAAIADEMAPALREAKSQVVELCITYNNPLPNSSLIRYDEALDKYNAINGARS